MKNSEVKRVWNWFTIADIEREEMWLNEMAASGWLLEEWDGGLRYTFRRGEHGKWLYKIDMAEDGAKGLEGEEYIAFLNECGIEVACRHKKWLFLRKKVSDGPFDAADALYSRLRITNKVYSYAIRALCYLVVICFAAISLSILGSNLFEGNFFEGSIRDFFDGASTGLGLGLTLGLTIFYVPAITKLRKKMDKLINEIGVKN